MSLRLFLLLWAWIFMLAFCSVANGEEAPCVRSGAQVICDGEKFDVFVKKYVACKGERDTCKLQLTDCQKDLEARDRALSEAITYGNALSTVVQDARTKSRWGAGFLVAGALVLAAGLAVPNTGVTTQAITTTGAVALMITGIVLTF